ncbi:tyrosine-type recombinase/integrase [Rhodococcus sp. UNC23MFCrub1.1]|uniref:tyrosine-type recombinase/integrase n=1 Tax=Rhodococcus sp. UNC23MFCrub1.1 TaxID=1449068 RepID=UPI000485D7AB|nr:site-specific integrase [Rhodococcus sp. UNC23MFCrub1.1]
MGANRYSIREQTTGRAQARWYDDAGKRRSKTFTTRTEAKKFLDNIKADRNRGDYIDPNEARRTFREVAELWFQSRNLRPKTAKSYRTILEHRIYPTFADRPIGSITTMDLTAWITDLSLHGKRVNHNNKGKPDFTNASTAKDHRRQARQAEERRRDGVAEPIGTPLAAGTVGNAVRVMNQVLDAAVRARYLRGNPANGLTRDDMPKHHREEVAFLSAGQVEELAQAMTRVAAEADHPDAEALGLLVRFAAQTGMRAGEICALRWENVDLLRNRITVSESISTLSSGEWYVVPPKTNKTRRVPLPPALAAALATHGHAQAARSAFAPEAYVWPTERVTAEAPYGSRPMHWGRDFYLPYWKRAARLAGLPNTLRAHDLRHSCAALLIAANVPAKAIQAHLGHSSFKVTMDIYGHLYDDASDAVTDAMDAAFAIRTHAGNVTPISG